MRTQSYDICYYKIQKAWSPVPCTKGCLTMGRESHTLVQRGSGARVFQVPHKYPGRSVLTWHHLSDLPNSQSSTWFTATTQKHTSSHSRWQRGEWSFLGHQSKGEQALCRTNMGNAFILLHIPTVFPMTLAIWQEKLSKKSCQLKWLKHNSEVKSPYITAWIKI